MLSFIGIAAAVFCLTIVDMFSPWSKTERIVGWFICGAGSGTAVYLASTTLPHPHPALRVLPLAFGVLGIVIGAIFNKFDTADNS